MGIIVFKFHSTSPFWYWRLVSAALTLIPFFVRKERTLPKINSESNYMQNYLWHDTKLNDKIRENEQEGNGFKRFEGLYHVCSSGFILFATYLFPSKSI